MVRLYYGRIPAAPLHSAVRFYDQNDTLIKLQMCERSASRSRPIVQLHTLSWVREWQPDGFLDLDHVDVFFGYGQMDSDSNIVARLELLHSSQKGFAAEHGLFPIEQLRSGHVSDGAWASSGGTPNGGYQDTFFCRARYPQLQFFS
jgi:hypothetical protein